MYWSSVGGVCANDATSGKKAVSSTFMGYFLVVNESLFHKYDSKGLTRGGAGDVEQDWQVRAMTGAGSIGDAIWPTSDQVFSPRLRCCEFKTVRPDCQAVPWEASRQEHSCG